MAARITREQAARWQVIVPWKLGDAISEVVAVTLTVSGAEITVELLGNKRPITFPVERAKLLADALRESIGLAEEFVEPTTEQPE